MRAYWLFLVVGAGIPYLMCYSVLDKMCLTSVMESGGRIDPEWVLTRCVAASTSSLGASVSISSPPDYLPRCLPQVPYLKCMQRLKAV